MAPFSSFGRGTRERGMALVSVLWVCLILGILAGATSQLARDDLRMAANLLDRTRAELAAEAAVATTIHRLAHDPQAHQPAGATHATRFAESEIRVRATDETGLVDLNAAPPALLGALFAAVGVEPRRADRLAERIESHRAAHAAAQARQDGAAPPPFLMREDLRAVPGIDAALFARAAPYLTVHTGLAQPERRYAPDPVRRALAGGEEPPVGRASRRAPRRVMGDVLRIHAEARSDGGAVAVRVAVVDLRTLSLGFRGGIPSYRFRLWTGGTRQLFAPDAD